MEWCILRRSLSPNAELVHKMSRCGTIRSSAVEAPQPAPRFALSSRRFWLPQHQKHWRGTVARRRPS